MKTFEEYMKDWWLDEFLPAISESEVKRLMEEMIGEEERIEDYIPEDAESPRKWLEMQDDWDRIYNLVLSSDAVDIKVDKFLVDMFLQATEWGSRAYYDVPYFVRDIIEDMVEDSTNYDNPAMFLDDITRYGCQSGMVGMFIYNSDCKKFYIDNIDDMEDYKMDMEESLGEPIRNRKELPHYVFMCWLCYEEIAYNIARTLFPKEF